MPWAIHGILPAGLYTGISALQTQVCAFIDVWETDWNDTIAEIDGIVYVKVGHHHQSRVSKFVTENHSSPRIWGAKINCDNS